jgi:isovaleryl-CoA dehydrogenase
VYELTELQQEIRSEADRFCRDKIWPLASKMDDDEHWPEELFPMLGANGYLGLTIPPAYGGQGMTLFDAGLVCEVMSKWNHSAMLGWAAHDNLCANNIYRNANEDVRRRYLPGLCDGSKVGALALTEPGAGSDAIGSMATTATRDGESYILNGRKLYITNGPIADVLLVYAKTDLSAAARGITAFVVESDTKGFSVAQKLVKMGFRGSETAELLFDDCRVPAENVVGEVNNGVAVVMSGLDLERAFLAPSAVGMADRCLELSLEYAAAREQFGRPIGDNQVIQFKLADMWLGIETARTYAYRVLAMCDAIEAKDPAEQRGHGAAGRGEIHAHSAAALLYATETLRKVADEAVQIHGGVGYMWEVEVNRIYRGAKLLEIGAGTQEVRRMIISGWLRGQE